MLKVRSTAVIGAVAGATIAALAPQVANAATRGGHAERPASQSHAAIPSPMFVGRLLPAVATDCQATPGGPGSPGGPGNPPPNQGGGGTGGGGGGGGGVGGGGGGGGAGSSPNIALNQLQRAANQAAEGSRFQIEVNTGSAMVGPAAAFGNYGSVVTVDLSKHPLQEIELLGTVEDCLLSACSRTAMNALLEKSGIEPSTSNTPIIYRYINAGIGVIPGLPATVDAIELVVRPQKAGG